MMKRRLRNGLLLALPVLLVWAFLQAGNYLSSPAQPPERSDIILALGGDNGGRVSVAARLYKQGYTHRIMLPGLERGRSLESWRLGRTPPPMATQTSIRKTD